MKKDLYLFKVENKNTGVISDFITYDLLQLIPNLKEDFNIYSLKMDNVTDIIDLNKEV